jgi:hypothetical protein
MSVLERLRTWNTARSERPVGEDPGVQGGREAEVFLRNLVNSHLNYKGAHLFAGRRVPCPRRRLRREIDLIVLTPKLINLIEVKNWSGELHDHGSIWVQLRRYGGELHHPNLIADNLEKRDVLLEYLRAHGIALERDFAARQLGQKVIFMNPKLTVSPSIATHPDIITRDKLDAYLNQQKRAGFAERVFCSVIEYCLGTESVLGNMSGERFQALAECIGGIPTWDRLQMYGGKMLTGDLHELHVGGNHIYRRDLTVRASFPVSWSRGSWGLFKAITGLGNVGSVEISGRGMLALSSRDVVSFHAVGEPGAVTHPLTRIEEIGLG